QHHPKYNISLRDDKSYPYLRLSVQETFPGIEIIRRPRDDGALYFGPYSSAQSLKEIKRLLQKVFNIRDCSQQKFSNRTRPCLNFDLHLCSAPCVRFIDEEQYRTTVEEMIAFLRGQNRELIESLRKEMEKSSESLNFERALKLRDQLRAIDRVLEHQHVLSEKVIDQDLFGIFREGGLCLIVILTVRGGLLLGKQQFPFHKAQGETEEILSSFLHQYYEKNFIPKEILLPLQIEEAGLLTELLGNRKGERVLLHAPQRGEKKALVKMAEENARELSATVLQRVEEIEESLLELQNKLGLSDVPRIIECYDISTLFGKESVGSRVRFVDGEPQKSGYRHYRIREVEGMDDFAMIAEVIERRVLRGGEMPDLMVIDGGRGQLNAALKTLEKLEIEHVEVVGLAKERVKRDYRATKIEKKIDRVFIPDRDEPLTLDPRSPALHLLQRIRDESHRFAITFHQQRRGKLGMRSILDEIPGIGKAKRLSLLRHFGSVAAIKEASVKELESVPGMSRSLAQKIRDFFRKS
ncbi:MAG: excinuclease ABC subunit UvrC, partial [Deltaproteobacteria bacterium]|nr:excinuclease ABC subunit UvrC [Deltaproteobacteria bacterium]